MYLLDTNFFINAHRSYYPLDIVPSFWNRVSELATKGSICSIDKVLNELKKGNDALTEWIDANLPAGFFQDSSQFIEAYAQVAQWANTRSTHYKRAAIAEFLHSDEADAWLVAAGMQTNFTLITHEISRPEMIARVAIPEPCLHFGVSYCDTITMFRALKVTF